MQPKKEKKLKAGEKAHHSFGRSKETPFKRNPNNGAENLENKKTGTEKKEGRTKNVGVDRSCPDKDDQNPEQSEQEKQQRLDRGKGIQNPWEYYKGDEKNDGEKQSDQLFCFKILHSLAETCEHEYGLLCEARISYNLMCGIAGKFSFSDTHLPTREEIAAMNAAQQSRGPDDEGVFVEGRIGLGHQRLSILDLSPLGHQPMTDSSGRYIMTFNGEIYNFLDLRKSLEAKGVRFKSHSDTEVILELYKEKGPGCLQDLRGMFALAIFDRQEKRLFLARDRIGKKPLKYFLGKDFFAFASTFPALHALPSVSREIDLKGMDQFLTYQYVPHPGSIFKDLHKLPPGHFLMVKGNGEMSITNYHQFSFEQQQELSEQQWEEAVENTLSDSVRLRLISDVPVGALLSGGIDSSLVVALMAKHSKTPVKTFSVGFEDKKLNELPFARLLADQYGTDHHELMVTADLLSELSNLLKSYDEPFADPSALPSLLICQLTSQHVKVALTGDGGDEAFGGYDRYRFLLYQTWLNPFSNPESVYRSWMQIIPDTWRKKLYTKELFEELGCASFTLPHEELPVLSRAILSDLSSYLPGDLLVKMDMASMKHSLEIRCPFLDQELFALSVRMPSALKIRHFKTKVLLKNIAKKYLPEKLLRRGKQGFKVPLRKWFSGPFRSQLSEALLDPKFLALGFKKNGIEELLASSGHERKIYNLLVLSHFFRSLEK